MKYILLILSITLLTSFYSLKEPVKITWEDLAEVEYEEVYLKEIDADFWIPVFTEKIKNLDSETVEIEGYYKLLDDDFVVISKNVFGSESCGNRINNDANELIELEVPDTFLEFSQDRASITGILKLNADDVYKLNYIIEVESIK